MFLNFLPHPEFIGAIVELQNFFENFVLKQQSFNQFVSSSRRDCLWSRRVSGGVLISIKFEFSFENNLLPGCLVFNIFISWLYYYKNSSLFLPLIYYQLIVSYLYKKTWRCNINRFISNRAEVNDFLNRLKNYINSSNFDINSDLFLSAGRNRQNYNTLLMLDFEFSDVVDYLESLSLTNYSHTFLDSDNNDPPYLYIFGKYISGKLIYIKIKLRNIGVRKKTIVCISFHEGLYPMNFPFL